MKAIEGISKKYFMKNGNAGSYYPLLLYYFGQVKSLNIEVRVLAETRKYEDNS
jgi:hypothetical protein